MQWWMCEGILSAAAAKRQVFLIQPCDVHGTCIIFVNSLTVAPVEVETVFAHSGHVSM